MGTGWEEVYFVVGEVLVYHDCDGQGSWKGIVWYGYVNTCNCEVRMRSLFRIRRHLNVYVNCGVYMYLTHCILHIKSPHQAFDLDST